MEGEQDRSALKEFRHRANLAFLVRKLEQRRLAER
jgi:hypothetical protein